MVKYVTKDIILSGPSIFEFHKEYEIAMPTIISQFRKQFQYKLM